MVRYRPCGENTMLIYVDLIDGQSYNVPVILPSLYPIMDSCSYGPLPVISTYNPICHMYNPICNQL